MKDIKYYVKKSLKNQKSSMNNIHNDMRALKGKEEFEILVKHCQKQRALVEKKIFKGIEDAKGTYNYLELSINQIKAYKRIIGYIRTRKTKGLGLVNGLRYIIETLQYIIEDIKKDNLDVLGGSTDEDRKYNDTDLLKLIWHSYTNILIIVEQLYLYSDSQSYDIANIYDNMSVLG